MASSSLTETLRETLAVFDASGTPLTTSEVADRLNLGRRSTYDRLQRLAEHDLVATKKVGASARVWWRPADTEREAVADAAVTEGLFVADLLDDVGVVVLDEDDTVVWTNDALDRFFGPTAEQSVGSDHREFLDAVVAPAVADPETVVEGVRAATDAGSEGRVLCHVEADGERRTRWLEHRCKAVDGEPLAGGSVHLYRDVTEQRRSDPSSQEFDSLVGAVEEYAIFRLDAAGRIRTWNSGAQAIKGYDADEAIGEHVSLFYTDGDRAAGVPDANLATAASDGVVHTEGWRVRADGSRFWANVTLRALYGDDDELRGYVKVTRDMTEQRERERQLRRERDLTELFLETAPIRMAVFSPDGTAERINSRARAQLGIDESAVPGLHVSELPMRDEAGESLGDGEHPVETVIRTGEPVSNRLLQHDGPDGGQHWVRVNASPVTDDDGRLECVVATGEDVTELQRKTRALERQRNDLERELDDVFDRIDDAFFALDDDWRFTHVNEQAASALERSVGDLVGQPIWEVFPEARDTTFQAEYERALRAQETVSFEEYFAPLSTWFEVTAYPSESGLSVYFRDITERKEREERLRRYRTVVETIDDGVYIVDGENRFVLVNEALTDLTGYDREELLGSHASMVTTDDDLGRAEDRRDALVTSDATATTIETELVTSEGQTVPIETRFSLLDLGDDDPARVGVVRNVGDRKERQEQLQRRMRQQEVITDLGQQALERPDLDALFAAATRLVADTLGIEYCKVLDLDADREELLLREGVGWQEGLVGEATVSAVEADSQAAYTLSVEGPVVVEDLTTESRFSGPDLLRDHDVRSGISTIIGPRSEPWGILGTHSTESRTFSEEDARFVQSVANILATAINRRDYERRLLDQREQLAALNSLNAVIRETTSAVIEQPTRETIESTVCEHIASSPSYLFAWIGDVDPETETVNLRTEAGVDGYLDGITISVDPDDERSDGPTGRAIRTGMVQTTQDVTSDSRHDPWRDHIEGHGVRSSAAIPLSYEGTTYGVLNVYSDRPKAFEGREGDLLGRFGEVVGHAIASTERKRALLSDEVVELQFRIDDVFGAFGVDARATGRITLDHVVPIDDEQFLVYGTVDADARADLIALTETVPVWDGVSFHDDAGTTSYELRLTEPPMLSELASVGGLVHEAVIEDGDLSLTVHLSPSTETRHVVDAIQETYPSVTLLKRRQRSATSDGSWDRDPLEPLTDRQRTTLRAAYHSGFFEWPRAATGESIADSLGVAPPTYHQHLRAAERKIFDSLLGGNANRFTDT
ncbi:PAS domain S-box protein [Haloarcula salina]|uniref:PAS domain S-box protein n=1 Tax=Haloarcula salina TaxID=1429914 RepID=UPI003C6F3A33